MKLDSDILGKGCAGCPDAVVISRAGETRVRCVRHPEWGEYVIKRTSALGWELPGNVGLDLGFYWPGWDRR